MSIDYDAHRTAPENDATEPVEELKPRKTRTCMSCFLVHHRSQLAREKDGKKYCIECEG
jgi:hypothetical protein